MCKFCDINCRHRFKFIHGAAIWSMNLCKICMKLVYNIKLILGMMTSNSGYGQQIKWQKLDFVATKNQSQLN